MGTRGNSKGQTPRASPEMPNTQSTDTEAGLHPLPDLRHIIISLGKKIRLFKTVDKVRGPCIIQFHSHLSMVMMSELEGISRSLNLV